MTSSWFARVSVETMRDNVSIYRLADPHGLQVVAPSAHCPAFINLSDLSNTWDDTTANWKPCLVTHFTVLVPPSLNCLAGLHIQGTGYSSDSWSVVVTIRWTPSSLPRLQRPYIDVNHISIRYFRVGSISKRHRSVDLCYLGNDNLYKPASDENSVEIFFTGFGTATDENFVNITTFPI